MRKPGETAPAFQLSDVDGHETSLQNRLANGPVLLAFFKITCPTCQLTLPFLGRMAAESGVPVIGISQDGASGTAEFNQAFGVAFPTLLDRADKGYRVSNAYGITHVPSLFLVEPDGRISLAESGFSRQVLEQIGQRFGATVFRESDRVPEFKPG